MKKKNIVFATLLLGVTLTASVVGKTYSRYITTDSGTGQATVAKWNATITGFQGTTGSKTLTLTPVANDYVATGLIAPDADAMGILTVDLSGTQVAVDLTADLGEITIENKTVSNIDDHFTTKLRIYDSSTTDAAIQADAANETSTLALAELDDSDDKYFIPLNTGKTAISKTGVKVAISLHWIHNDEISTDANDLTNGMNGWDTVLGEYGTGSAPVIKAELNLTAQQHVVSDGTPS